MAISFDRIAHRYDETRGGERRGREFAADIRPWLVPGSVLEVGVGTGVVAAALANSGTSVVGIDISPKMAKQAYVRLGPRIALGDALALPIKSASVDNVLFVMALHLVGDVPPALAEGARVLRPRGRVVAVHGEPVPERTDLLDALRPLDRVRTQRPDHDEVVATSAVAAGLHRAYSGWTTAYPFERSPRQVADEIEERTWSFLWHLDEAEWEAGAVPAIRALRALPEPDRRRSYSQRLRISVFQRPA